MVEDLSLFIVSLISNIFSAFSGGGAGVIQLPAILLLYEISFITALASHKVATVALGVGATLKYFRKIRFNNQFIITCLIIGIPGVVVGANVISMIDDSIARIMLGALIIMISLYSFFSKGFGEETTHIGRTIFRDLFVIVIISQFQPQVFHILVKLFYVLKKADQILYRNLNQPIQLMLFP